MSDRPILHLICGLPGAGKTTLGKQLEQAVNAIRFSPDEWLSRLGIGFYDEAGRDKVERLQWELAQQLLRHGNDVVLENGFWSREERDRYRAVADKIGATTKIHFLDVPLAELKLRIARRNHTRDPDTPEIDPSSLDEWAGLFEPPNDDELAQPS
ncbi:ATP-binding protein [Aquamicrobium sp. NLF2-7]|uniref:AAA family ATPase n=1 Tax=Aquamicrobium sp. NLF2-7 TaxID=2918753 RepID=UPI001EFC08D0|nr:ATP-binding protein [Aquamicrobium sp. NLF2-7]MCG8273922.1 ATP-binding protein [Aquamicrobium sp. NLF2-7]